MLYQKGEKLAKLRQTIKDIPLYADLKRSEFIMPKKELKKFESSIIKPFNNLNSVLFSTLTNEKTEDENRDMVYRAISNIILYLVDNYEHDLEGYFYEERLALYEKFFVILVRDKLYKKYPEYKDLLEVIPKEFRKEQKTDETKFPRISYLINVHDEIYEDLDSGLSDSTVLYLYHSIEMIYEEISELIIEESETDYLNPDVLPNRLRQLIYLLKSELPNVFEEPESEEE